jgi:hypothetical protein
MAEVRSTYIEPRQLARGHPDEHVVEALEAHIATLMEAIARAEALGEQRRHEAQKASKQVDALISELLRMTKLMAEQVAATDKIRAEFDAYRSRSWWKRFARRRAERAAVHRVRAEFGGYWSRPWEG